MEQEIRFDTNREELLLELVPSDSVFGAVQEQTLPVHRGLMNAAAWQLAMKRVLDILVSALAIVVLAPLLLAVALLVKLTSPGPVFYVQRRVGKAGAPFRMAKFRSMYMDAHDHRDEHVHSNMHVGPIFKIRDDPRVTPVGRAIRRFSIDELPQLFNVLLGNMSLVGPRPPLPEEFLRYSARDRGRIAVKPGVTCIWQVSGRSDLDFETWIDMDLEYIQTWSLRLDLRLLAKTVPAVLSGRGAY